MPFTLKKQLVTDWQHITQDRRLVALPRELTAAAVMSRYMETKATRGATQQQTLRAQELMDGVRTYFDKVGGGGRGFLPCRQGRMHYVRSRY